MTAGIITETEPGQMRWRLRLGLVVLVIGFLSPLLIPLVSASALPTKWKTVISGLLAVGIPELFSILAIAIMGKAGFNYIKKRFFAFLKKHGPADKVSRTRYRIGLVMFGLPIFFGWLAPYVPIVIPGYDLQGLMVNLIGDLMFISSLFVLGGDFWDKVRALFVYGATAKFPEPSST
ncbi:MAG: transporter suffix domain-containing protein [Desulfobacteraceae bacterium]|nr:transporter suffix domain-containing protein [Desulfobacteraceae bacterium]